MWNLTSLRADAIFWAKYFIIISYEKLKKVLCSGRDNLHSYCVCWFDLVHVFFMHRDGIVVFFSIMRKATQ